MSLHTSYRPTELDDFVGNSDTVNALRALFKRAIDFPHTILFEGPIGCGKTSLARIIAKRLGSDFSPLSFHEYNASNNRGIETAREIADLANRRSFDSKVRVFILDEIHQSTRDYQNALLKVLEEPPNFCYFILCTTNPEKLIKAVKSRCMKFKVKPLNTQELYNLLCLTLVTHRKETAEYLQENGGQRRLVIEKSIIKRIAELAEGVPREGLILLEKILHVNPDQIEAVLGSAKEEKKVIDLCRALLKNNSDWNIISSHLLQLEEDPETVRKIVLAYMNKVLLGSGNTRQAAHIIDCFIDPLYGEKAALALACYNVIQQQ